MVLFGFVFMNKSHGFYPDNLSKNLFSTQICQYTAALSISENTKVKLHLENGMMALFTWEEEASDL